MLTTEIAELTGKAHKNVLADTRKMLGELGKAEAEFSAVARVPGPNKSMRDIPAFRLPKRETMVLVTGYSIPLRAAVIDRLDGAGLLVHPTFERRPTEGPHRRRVVIPFAGPLDAATGQRRAPQRASAGALPLPALPPAGHTPMSDARQ